MQSIWKAIPQIIYWIQGKSYLLTAATLKTRQDVALAYQDKMVVYNIIEVVICI